MDGVFIHQFRYEHDYLMWNVPATGSAYDPRDNFEYGARRASALPSPDFFPIWDAVLNLRVPRTHVCIASTGGPAESSVRNAASRQTIQSVFLPSFLEDMDDLTLYEEFAVVGKDVRFHMAAVVPPQLATAFGGRRWLDEWVPPPRNRNTVNKLRLTMFDAILVALRAIQELCVHSVVGHGERLS